MAHSKYHHCLDKIDFNLDALRSSVAGYKTEFEQTFPNFPYFKCNFKAFLIAYREIELFKPDLIISDRENISARMALMMNIPFWSCSPLNIVTGAKLPHSLRLNVFQSKGDLINYAQRKIIYSPFGSVTNRPVLRPGYEWVIPYHKDNPVKDATTSAISDIIFSGSAVPIYSNYRDREQRINSKLIEYLRLGCVVGGTDRLSFVRRKLENFKVESKLKQESWGHLHEKILKHFQSSI
jgi:hypothetical protein